MRKYLSFLIFCFLFISCVGVPWQQLEQELDVSSYVPDAFEWQEVCPGVARYDFKNAEVPLIYHAVKIDLSSPGLSLVWSQWERTSEFAERENCVAAINATPFDKTRLAGILKADGEVLSGPVARYAALGLRCGEDGAVTCARVFESQKDAGLADCDFAFGGFFVVLEGGKVRTEFVRRGDSRSGAGVSADGKTLYLLVVEGERFSKSIGLSYPQCGEIFRAMGCRDALEFDGGGSSELCINGRSVLSYRVRRVQGNSLGFRVK